MVIGIGGGMGGWEVGSSRNSENYVGFLMVPGVIKVN